MLDTVERERPVARAISARLAVPRPRRASMTRPRFNSRSERSEPESADPIAAAALRTAGGLSSLWRNYILKSAGVALGVDFGHTHLRVAVSDLSHEVLAESVRNIDVDHSAAEGLDAAADLVEDVLKRARVQRKRVLGVGMGVPGPINRATGAVGSSAILPSWVGVDAAAEMTKRLRMPVHVENDANLGALAELVWGSGKGFSDLIYIKLSSGVGAGLLLGGRLYHGTGGTAGEIGHTVVQPGGEICRCGSRGCLETVASARAIAEVLSASRGEPVSIKELLELATEGDAAAVRLIGEAGRQIGVAVANLCNVINPDRVIVGGDMSAAGTLITEPILESIRRYAILSAAEQVTVVPGTLGDRAELLGALALVLQPPERFLASPPQWREVAAA